MKFGMRALILYFIVVVASACGSTGQVTVEDAWARPGFLGDNSAVYLKILNRSQLDENLIWASSDVAGEVEIHLSQMDEAGTMSMERQNLIVVPAGSTVEFSPGGLHIMLVGLMKDLSAGDSFPLTLEFQRAGDIPVQVKVRAP